MDEVRCIQACAEHDYIFEGHHVYLTYYVENELSFQQWLGRIEKLEGENGRLATIYFYEGKSTEQRELQADLYIPDSELFRREEAAWRLAEGPPSRTVPRVIEDPAELGAYSASSTTSEAMAAFVRHLVEGGWRLRDVGASTNSCALLCVLSQAFPVLSRHGRDATTRAAVQRYRGLLADHLLQQYQQQLTLPPGLLADQCQLSIGDAIIGLQAGEGDIPAADSDEGAELVLRHCEALRGEAQVTQLDMQALVQVLSEQEQVHVTVECWSPGAGGAIVKTEMAAASPPPGAPVIHITVANVWFDWVDRRRAARKPGASGMLDHFMLVVPAPAAGAAEGAAGEGAPGAGGPALKRLRRMSPDTPGQGSA